MTAAPASVSPVLAAEPRCGGSLRPASARLLLAGAAAALSWATPALADRPLVSETADVIPAEACQVELGAASLRARAVPKISTLDLLASCGNRWNSQFGIGLAEVRSKDDRIQRASLVGKTTLVMPDEDRTGFGLGYGVAAERERRGSAAGPAQGLAIEREADQGWQHADVRLLAVATRQLTKHLLGHANLGWIRTRSDGLHTTIWSVGLEGDQHIRWAADLYGDDRSKPWASFGLLVPVEDKISLNLAYARQLGGERAQQITLGAKIEF